VAHAADLIPHVAGGPVGEGETLSEGPRWEIVVSPGVLRVRTRDYVRAERAHERAVERHRKRVDVEATWDGDVPELLPTRGAIVAWTRRSRARLIERLSDLDYTKLYGRFHVCARCGEEFDEQLEQCPACRSVLFTVEDRTGRLPAMLTLTYPGDWLTVAPTSEASMGHFQALCKRYERAWGEPLRGPWKKEFQGRGAPHFHISTTPPMGLTTVTDPETGQPRRVDFRRWLSITWAEIVGHPDPEQRRRHLLAGTGVDYAQGVRLTDPRRMAVYFAKYGAAATGKEYQHCVPREWLTTVLVCTECGVEYDQDLDECPDCGSPEADVVEQGSAGRFWGYRGLRRVLAVRQVTPRVGIAAGRIARRWYRAKGLTKQVTVERVEQATGRVTYRRSRVRKRLFAHGRGFLCVNDGAVFASQLARYLARLDEASPPTDPTAGSPSRRRPSPIGSGDGGLGGAPYRTNDRGPRLRC
jgi:RNA polymerase subunit RPABC4/transcription elongation factor Spt4